MKKATLEQGHQLVTFLLREDYPKGFIQNLLSNWGAVQMIGSGEIDQAIFQAAVKEMANPFAKEKTDLRWFYPNGWKPTSVAEQLAVLLGFYPDLDSSHVVEIATGITVPEDADGLFVVPKPSSIAAKLGITTDPLIEGYGQMLEASVLAQLAGQRKFHNYRAGELTPDQVRMRQSAADAIRKLEEETPGDFLVFAAQTGKKWGGYSPQNARWDIERKSESEFPLPAWCVGHIILTNPTRLEAYKILLIDCPGDEYLFDDGAGFGYCLCFGFDAGSHLKLSFDRRWLNSEGNFCGSASGFSG